MNVKKREGVMMFKDLKKALADIKNLEVHYNHDLKDYTSLKLVVKPISLPSPNQEQPWWLSSS